VFSSYEQWDSSPTTCMFKLSTTSYIVQLHRPCLDPSQRKYNEYQLVTETNYKLSSSWPNGTNHWHAWSLLPHYILAHRIHSKRKGIHVGLGLLRSNWAKLTLFPTFMVTLELNRRWQPTRLKGAPDWPDSRVWNQLGAAKGIAA